MSLLALAAAVLEGFAVLPAGTLASGPLSGQFIEAPPGVEAPFASQPVQGVSALAAGPDGNWYALLDNGYGTRANSADFVLRIYSLKPRWRSADGGAGDVQIGAFIELSDPQQNFPQAMVAEREHYPGSEVPVDGAIREGRLFTGADLDPESLLRMADGSFWIGDEFGPWLLHFSATGELLEPPYGIDGVAAPEYSGQPSLGSSKGFEGLAAGADDCCLYALLEGSLPGEEGLLNIYRFDLGSRRFVPGGADAWSYRYRLDPQASAIGAFRLLDATRGLVLERDSLQGEMARFKKVFAVDLGVQDAEGVLRKTELVDLLDIADPQDLDGDGAALFRFDHQTPESIIPAGDGRLLIVNDNNYPFGRARAADQPDATEFILLRVEEGYLGSE